LPAWRMYIVPVVVEQKEIKKAEREREGKGMCR
jgi:hypothetical protein